MANNVMLLVNHRLKAAVALAKYYPETGWYFVNQPGKGVAVEGERSAFGAEDWEIVYEDSWNDVVHYTWYNDFGGRLPD